MVTFYDVPSLGYHLGIEIRLFLVACVKWSSEGKSLNLGGLVVVKSILPLFAEIFF